MTRRTFYNRNTRASTTAHTQTHYRRSTPDYPSASPADKPGAVATRPTYATYTGNTVIGIATMHKSNLVPVTAGIKTNPKITD